MINKEHSNKLILRCFRLLFGYSGYQLQVGLYSTVWCDLFNDLLQWL